LCWVWTLERSEWWTARYKEKADHADRLLDENHRLHLFLNELRESNREVQRTLRHTLLRLPGSTPEAYNADFRQHVHEVLARAKKVAP
jgi:uncharacterized alpha-E superfamily protein